MSSSHTVKQILDPERARLWEEICVSSCSVYLNRAKSKTLPAEHNCIKIQSLFSVFDRGNSNFRFLRPHHYRLTLKIWHWYLKTYMLLIKKQRHFVRKWPSRKVNVMSKRRMRVSCIRALQYDHLRSSVLR